MELNHELKTELNSELNRVQSRVEKSREEKKLTTTATTTETATSTTEASPHKLLMIFDKLYKSTWGIGYPIIDGKDHKLAKKLLESFGFDLERIEWLMKIGFTGPESVRKFMDTFGGFYGITPKLEKMARANEFSIEKLAESVSEKCKVKHEYSWKMENGNYVKVRN
jgi:hypothetical protein